MEVQFRTCRKFLQQSKLPREVLAEIGLAGISLCGETFWKLGLGGVSWLVTAVFDHEKPLVGRVQSRPACNLASKATPMRRELRHDSNSFCPACEQWRRSNKESMFKAQKAVPNSIPHLEQRVQDEANAPFRQ